MVCISHMTVWLFHVLCYIPYILSRTFLLPLKCQEKNCGKINLFIYFLNWLSNAESWWGWNPAQNVIGWEVDRYSLFRYIVHCRVKQKGEFLGLCHVEYGTQWDYIFNGRRLPPLGQRCIPLGLSHLLNTSIVAESHYVLSKLNSFYCALFKKNP